MSFKLIYQNIDLLFIKISSSGYSEQVMFRDSKNMYFFTGNREDLDNFSFEELINKKKSVLKK